jgi:hypothetical protein
MGSGGTIDAPTDVPTMTEIEAPRPGATCSGKEKRTAEELAVMIRQDLSSVDGCPKRGVTVTVYGLNPWNSMLTFGAAAGPVPQQDRPTGLL